MRFSEEALASCKSAFPKLDVDRIAERTAARLSLPGAKELSNPDAYLFKVCESCEAEGKFKVAAGAGGQRAEAQGHFGFAPTGNVIRSEIPVTNAPTNFVRFLIREIREQLLTPAEVVALISRHPDNCHALFRRDVIQDWCVRDTLHGWASAQACTSLEESVRSWGGTYPWAKDPYLWGELLKSWEARSPDAAAASTA